MARVDARLTALRHREREANLAALREALRRQLADVAASGGQLAREWDDDLADVVLRRNTAAATEAGMSIAHRFSAKFDALIMREILDENARITAEQINAATRERINRTGYVDAFRATRSRVAMYARTMAGMAVNLGAREGALQGGARWKTWQVNSGNPRSSHAAMAGERVRIGDTFSNGLRWPGDAAGGDADERANCECSMVLSD